jgi:eukaryotic-like serine/threonine-protein kinase
MLSPDTVFQARYRIVRQLGQGGMGAVYEAVDERLDTVVALKETLFTDERLRKQFEREARLLARLHHQALPRVSDHFTEGDGQFLVMQYIAGEDLFEMLTRRKGPFPQEEVLLWADQLCDALDYLHTQDPQIIHRDIKPQNLKLTARGQAVLLDFGLAKGSAGQMSVATTSASIFGYTPNYAPLEQVQGLGTDPRSDIYALAATLYHLLTNVKPPDALSRAGAMVNGQPDPLIPANQVAAVSGAVAAVLTRGMSQKRDDRYASALDMREALRLAAANQTAEAATIVGADPAALANANTILLDQATKVGGSPTAPMTSEAKTLLAGDATSFRTANLAAETATVVRPANNGNRTRVLLGAALVVLILAGGAGGFYLYKKKQAQQQQNVSPAAQVSPQQPEANQTTNTSSQPAAGEKDPDIKIDNVQADTKQRTVTSKPSTTKANQANNRAAEQSTTVHDRDRNPDRNPQAGTPPQPPAFDPFRNPQAPGHTPGTNQTPPTNQRPTVRTLPNGVRIVTQPDGTRIMIMPNGTTRVMPPVERPNRRRRNP